MIDNGAGIPPPMMKHMFELFHSTKGNRGTGLGLAVAKKIVDEHEGSITVKSTPGEGTTFTSACRSTTRRSSDPSHDARAGALSTVRCRVALSDLLLDRRPCDCTAHCCGFFVGVACFFSVRFGRLP